MAAGRGPSWRRAEIIDLLAVWGEEKVQSSLRQSHRNFDVFEEVAEKMRERGHNKSAEECRSKSKSLRLAYKRILSHTQKSGNDRITCPFYEELEKILQGGPTVKMRRTSQSMTRKTATRNEAEEEGTLDLFPFSTQERGELLEDHPQHQDIMSDEWTTNEESVQEDSDSTRISSVSGTAEAGTSGAEDTVGEEDRHEKSRERDPDKIPPDVPLSQLSLLSRLALRKKRRERLSAVQRVGELMMRQSAKEHGELLETIGGASNILQEELRNNRELERQATDRMCTLFENAVSAMRDIPRAIHESTEYRQSRHLSDLHMERPTSSVGFGTHQGWVTQGGQGQRQWGGASNLPQAVGFQRVCESPLAEWGGYQGGMSVANAGSSVQSPDNYSMCGPPFQINVNYPPPTPPNTMVTPREAPTVAQRETSSTVNSLLAPSTPTRERPKRQIKASKKYSPSD